MNTHLYILWKRNYVASKLLHMDQPRDELGRFASTDSTRTAKSAELLAISFIGAAVTTGIMWAANKLQNARAERVLTNIDDEKIEKWKDLKKGKPDTIEDAAAKTNPNYSRGFLGETSKNKAWLNNCSNCTIAYEMRRRGYNVEARPHMAGRNDVQIIDMFKNATFKDNVQSFKSSALPIRSKDRAITKALDAANTNWPNGARGYMTVFTQYGGHVLNVEKVNNQVRFVEAQSNELKLSRNHIVSNSFDVTTANIARIDNLQFSNNALECIRRSRT